MPDEEQSKNKPPAASDQKGAEAAGSEIASAKAALPKSTQAATVAEAARPATSTSRGKDMEIHAPDKPIHTKKEFMFHMFTVILGILIALGLEGIVEWAHHRALVREARANIAQEIAANRKNLAMYLEEIPKREGELSRIVAVMQEIERTGKFTEREVTYNYQFHSFDSAAWHTASLSGAVTYMDYNEVQRYTDAYDGQQEIQLMENEALKELLELTPRLAILNKDLKKVPPQRLQEIEQLANKGLILMQALDSLCKSTDQAYAKASSQQ